MRDLTPEEREALRESHRSWERRTLVSADPEEALASLVLAALAAVPRLREVGAEPDLWWPVTDGECSAPDAGELAYMIELDAGQMVECAVARTVGRRWVASLPTDFERDDGWEGGIGWLDGEPTDFATEAEARAALEKRKAELLAVVEVATPEEGGQDG